jgi:hypothetical protein
MNLKTLCASIRSFFRPGVNTTSFLGSIQPVPAGMVADAFALYGLMGLMANIEAIDFDLVAIAGGTSVSVTMTGAQFFSNVIDYSGSPAGGVALNTPTLAQINQAMPPSYPTSGYNFPLIVINDSAGQTVTLTSGGTGVTVVGTATILTATVRLFVVSVTPTAVNIVNCGGWSL